MSDQTSLTREATFEPEVIELYVDRPKAEALSGTGQSHGTDMPAADATSKRPRQTPARELTVSEAKAAGIVLPTRPLEEMTTEQFDKMSLEQRRDWYLVKLGPYGRQLRESAKVHNVPVQLLAGIIFTELEDISWIDVMQESSGATKGSFGIAQIQIDTAIRDKLFTDITEEEMSRAVEEALPHDPVARAHAAQWAGTGENRRRLAIGRRLRVPQYAIDAAAKEIRILLDRMSVNHDKAWQQKFEFTAKAGVGGQAVYDFIGGPTAAVREGALAHMVGAAYNSPDIIVANNPSEDAYPGARAHGFNAFSTAQDLMILELFGGKIGSRPKLTPPR